MSEPSSLHDTRPSSRGPTDTPHTVEVCPFSVATQAQSSSSSSHTRTQSS